MFRRETTGKVNRTAAFMLSPKVGVEPLASLRGEDPCGASLPFRVRQVHCLLTNSKLQGRWVRSPRRHAVDSAGEQVSTRAVPRILRGRSRMAVVRRLEHLSLEKDSQHTDVECTYSIVTDDEGRRYLQI